MVKRKTRKRKPKGVSLGEGHESGLIYDYKCDLCGKTVPHWNRASHINDSKHTEKIYPMIYKPVKSK